MLLEKQKRPCFSTENIEVCSDDFNDYDEKSQMKTIKYMNSFLKKQEYSDKFTFLKKIRKI